MIFRVWRMEDDLWPLAASEELVYMPYRLVGLVEVPGRGGGTLRRAMELARERYPAGALLLRPVDRRQVSVWQVHRLTATGFEELGYLEAPPRAQEAEVRERVAAMYREVPQEQLTIIPVTG